MRACPDLCDEVVARLRKLGFVFDESEDHEQIFAALAQVHLGFSPPVNWTVTIRVTQTAHDSELDEKDFSRNPGVTYQEKISACCEPDAIERAKDQFHGKIAIGRMDDFQIEYTAIRTVVCHRNHQHHLLVPPPVACPECGENDLCNLTRDDADDVHCLACGHRYHSSRWY